MGPSNTLLSGHQSYILYACSLCGLWGPICYDGFNYCGYAFTQDWSQAQFAASFCLGPMAAGMLIGGDGSQHGWHSDPGCSPGWCGTVVDRTGSHCGLLRDQYGTTKDFDHLSDESHESILCIKNMIALQWQCDRCTRRTDETVGREKVNTDKIGNWNQPVKVRLGIRHCFQRCHRSRIHRKCHLIGLSYIKGRGMSDSWVSVLDK